MNYSDLLKSPLWQKKRLEILQANGFQCRLCYDMESQLHVHHQYYAKGKNPWEYPDDCFIVLCENCHQIVHKEIAYRLDDDFVKLFKDSGKKYITFLIFSQRLSRFVLNSSDKQINEMSKIIEAQTIKREEF